MRRLALALERAWSRPPRLLWLLWPLELLFVFVTALRRGLYRRGILASGHPGVPVIVVGNLTVGGTGKTPVVMALARALADAGERVAVVSRGYGGRHRSARAVAADSDPAEVGDEALLMARSLPVPVFVGRDRLAAAGLARDAGASVIVCDDGLQHYRLRRDIEVLTMDARHGLGNGHRLPVGPLRERPERAREVDFLLERDGGDPVTALRFRPGRWRRLDDTETRPADAPGFGPRVHALAAIARPERFFATLRTLGLEPVEHALRDHEAIDAALLGRLADLPLVMTTKDAVKCAPGAHDNAWKLEMDVEFPAAFVPAVIDRIVEIRGGQR